MNNDEARDEIERNAIDDEYCILHDCDLNDCYARRERECYDAQRMAWIADAEITPEIAETARIAFRGFGNN